MALAHDEEALKRCPGCEEELPQGCFYQSGHRLQCKACCRAWQNEYNHRRRQTSSLHEEEEDSQEDVEAAQPRPLQRPPPHDSCLLRQLAKRMRKSSSPPVADEPAALPDHLYLAHNPRIPGEVKVGRAHNVEARMKALSMSQNFALRVLRVWPGCGPLEREVHEQLAKHRLQGCPGREWFALGASASDSVDEVVLCLQLLRASRERLATAAGGLTPSGTSP